MRISSTNAVRETVASAQRQDAFAELLLADDFFGQRFRIGAERQRAAVVVFTAFSAAVRYTIPDGSSCPNWIERL